ncbi:ABC transporter permease [Protaetiibacter intestinalis]|uniref:ABC transporter permease n=1 Tax=Protaetiibacter intestinalis TaxID=2419774 RepID=UPI001D05B38D|nr:ABC transporter permease [Protaetiibacter intestinalis]
MGTASLTAEARAAAVASRRFGAWFVAEHHLRVWRRYLGVSVATAVGTPFMYLLAFGIGLGVLVNANTGPAGVDGVSYLVFIAPALIATSAVMIASDEFSYPVMQGLKWNRVYFGMHAAPLSARQVVDGLMIFASIRIAATTLVYFLVMAAFGGVPAATGVLTVPVAVLSGIALGAPLFAYSASLREDRGQFAVMQRVLVLPLTLFSGTLFPLDQLPAFLQPIGWLSPLWHGAELGRVVGYGADRPGWLIAVHLVFLVVLAVAGWRLAVRVMRGRLDT